MSERNFSLPFTCPVCGEEMPRNLSIVNPHMETHITNEIRKQHPEWAESDGICKKCYQFYKEQLHKK